MQTTLSKARIAAVEAIATGSLTVQTTGRGFTDITASASRFLTDCAAADGVLLLFLRHTSASLSIQENADPAVREDLTTALDRLAPEDGGWVHDTEGADDMPAHVKTMLTGISLHVPIVSGGMALGTWQGIYLLEHRARAHRREVTLHFIGSRK